MTYEFSGPSLRETMRRAMGSPSIDEVPELSEKELFNDVRFRARPGAWSEWKEIYVNIGAVKRPYYRRLTFSILSNLKSTFYAEIKWNGGQILRFTGGQSGAKRLLIPAGGTVNIQMRVRSTSVPIDIRVQI